MVHLGTNCVTDVSPIIQIKRERIFLRLKESKQKKATLQIHVGDLNPQSPNKKSNSLPPFLGVG